MRPGLLCSVFLRYALANRIISSWLLGPLQPGQQAQQAHLQQQGAARAAVAPAPSSTPEGPRAQQASGWLGDLLPDVSIDEGTFKYVLLRVTAVESPCEDEGHAGHAEGAGGAGGAEPPPTSAGGPSYISSSNSSSSSSSSNGTQAAEHSASSAGAQARRPGPPAARSKLIVRGDARAPYHDDIYKAALREVASLAPGAAQQLRVETLGGGRMEHHPHQHLLSIYGYSSAFGQAPHEVTAALARRWLPFHDVEVSYDGY
jgi:phosphohistidine phosphatase